MIALNKIRFRVANPSPLGKVGGCMSPTGTISIHLSDLRSNFFGKNSLEGFEGKSDLLHQRQSASPASIVAEG